MQICRGRAIDLCRRLLCKSDTLMLYTRVTASTICGIVTTRSDAELQIAAFRGNFPGDLLDQTRASASSADASVAAGPVGRSTAADTDLKLHAEILTYSRSRGRGHRR